MLRARSRCACAARTVDQKTTSTTYKRGANSSGARYEKAILSSEKIGNCRKKINFFHSSQSPVTCSLRPIPGAAIPAQQAASRSKLPFFLVGFLTLSLSQPPVCMVTKGLPRCPSSGEMRRTRTVRQDVVAQHVRVVNRQLPGHQAYIVETADSSLSVVRDRRRSTPLRADEELKVVAPLGGELPIRTRFGRMHASLLGHDGSSSMGS